jgi:hypothetical protein
MQSSDDRSPLDLAQFGFCFFGLIIGIGGVVISSLPIAVFGGLLLCLGVAYFAIEETKGR